MSIGKVYQKWSRDMVHLLLSEIRHLWPKFRNKKYTMKMLYEDASTKLREYGYEVSAYRVEKKWHNLASTYRNVLNKMHNYGEESITRRHEYFEAMHELMGNMNAVRQKSSVSPLEEMLPGTSQTRSSSPLSPASTLASPPSSPEPSRKRIRTDEHSSPKIILIPAVQNHDQVYPEQSVPIQTQVKGHIKQQIIDDAEEQESRREWREWKRQQELINVQREGNRVLENIDNNLVAIRKSLDFIVQKLSNQG
ncbi:uncharacterized protein LOC121864026 [Homarus americanus]|uniref:Putative Myb/SANT-like DNA-binding domain-containing protein 2 n=1 Tax=Homarus americanus TaxID=6706 RepID=A0A8J5K7K1_HOMAM|nr:uncharacterized protein LOC121864026 [Homarus americanus]XP_042218842.1 uncharacterized protein LOC121864026 [Homarus americanus]KAG7170791.1 putative Myb/SANT-like DNA-binding domain-containing protein 2 [Homarus americanus]